MVCKNCNFPLKSKFCGNCGQKSQTERVNAKYVLQEIPNSILQVDRGFFYTVKELFTRPGHSIREYLEGKRVKHYKPIAFALLLSTLYAILILIGGGETILGEALGGFTQGIIDAGNKRESTLSNLELKLIPAIFWVKDHYSYATLILVPLFSIATYVSFLGKGYNYFEHLILNLYVEGQKMILYFLFIPFLYFVTSEDIKDNLQTIQFLIGIVIGFWTYIQFFKNTRVFSSVSRLILSYTIYCTIFGTLFALGILIVLIVT